MLNETQSGSKLERRRLPQANLAHLRSAKRHLGRERIHAQVVHPIDTPSLLPDPLARRESRASSAILGVRLVVGAAMIHGLVVLGFALFGQLLGEQRTVRVSERLKISIVEPKEPPPPPEQALRVPAPLSPEFARPAPPRKLDVSPKKPKETADAAPEAVVTPDPIPRRVVGLSLESTVEGKGPSFATGTTRMGSTEKQAVDPERAARAPSGRPPEVVAPGPKGNVQRAAAHIPSRDGQFEKPKRLTPIKPEYSPALKAQNIEGDVVVSVDIAESGIVTRVTILRSSGQPAFDEAARRAALAEKFMPALRDGVPVAFTLSYTYRYRIEE
jgi:periplasmic protein TonB